MSSARPSQAFTNSVEALASAEYGLDLADGDDRRYLLRDVLTDCRHYADSHGINFFDVLDGSYQVYLEELN